MTILSLAVIFQTNQVQLQRIIDLSKADNRVMRHLHELCFDIGARVSGSPELQKAEQWAVRKFRSFGCSNVHLEKVADVPVGFHRGPNNAAWMVEPFRSEIKFSTNCWMPGTNGPKRGPVVLAPTSMDELIRVKAQLKGAWVLSSTPVSMRGPQIPRKDAELTAAISNAGALGIVYGSKNDLLFSHGTWKDKTFEKHPTNVEVTVRKDDWDRLNRNVRFGRKTVAEFNVDNRWVKGPIPISNVVAEIKGSEKPDEVVIIGGHLDSWNTPGSQGANDNGTGSCATLEAARLLVKSGLRPKRTIRFILFASEEQGLIGSRGYVKAHADELDKISACIVDDHGSNYESGTPGFPKWAPYFAPVFDLMTKNFPTMPMEFTPMDQYNAEGGSDQVAFWEKKIPAFYMHKAGPQEYPHVWHTQYDRYEEVIPESLKQMSTNLAVLSFNLANADSLLPRP